MIHLFHKWSKWEIKKEELVEERRQYYADEPVVALYRFYRIHERRVCLRCNRVEYRIRESS